MDFYVDDPNLFAFFPESPDTNFNIPKQLP